MQLVQSKTVGNEMMLSRLYESISAKNLLFAFLPLSLIFAPACNETKFTKAPPRGEFNKNLEEEPEVTIEKNSGDLERAEPDEPSVAKPEKPETEDKEEVETLEEIPDEVFGDIVTGKCEIVPDYDPLAIMCSISPNDPRAIWNNVPEWKLNSDLFVDRTASWISPLAKAMSLDGERDLCPEVPLADKLIYVSYLKVTTGGNFTFEIMNDNEGIMSLWKDGNSKTVTESWMTNEIHAPRSIFLVPGIYSIVLESIDNGVASAVLLSVQDSIGQVVKNTATDGTWCIFRTSLAENTPDYVTKASKCRKCLTGIEFKGE